jgi:glyoxylase-like metal-dependent hydrolase (beta-lactamase superfamily II)
MTPIRVGDLLVRPEHIDYLFCTHMQADHIGWNTPLNDECCVPTLPHARYVFARREFEHREASWRLARRSTSTHRIQRN